MGLVLSVSNYSSNLINSSINMGISCSLYKPPNNYRKTIPNNSEVFIIKNYKKRNDIRYSDYINFPFNQNDYIEEVSVMKIRPIIDNHPNKVIIFSHGNSSNIYTKAPYLKRLSDLLCINIICYDYPSYGDTNGLPTEKNCVECLNIVIEDTLNYYKNIILVGQSLGTGIVIDYVSNHKWLSPILLISPYKSIPRVITDNSIADSFTSQHCYQSIDKISNAICPIKIVHGEKDTLIPMSHANDLYILVANKQFLPTFIPDTGHNDILGKIDHIYIELINSILC
jgi:pimeloyl-ACP methyl ester carboxylesterase